MCTNTQLLAIKCGIFFLKMNDLAVTDAKNAPKSPGATWMIRANGLHLRFLAGASIMHHQHLCSRPCDWFHILICYVSYVVWLLALKSKNLEIPVAKKNKDLRRTRRPAKEILAELEAWLHSSWVLARGSLILDVGRGSKTPGRST